MLCAHVTQGIFLKFLLVMICFQKYSLPAITAQIGVAINTDATRLLTTYGIEVTNNVDLRTLAKSPWVEVSSGTLSGMVACLLLKNLPRNPDIRFSNWASRDLSDR